MQADSVARYFESIAHIPTLTESEERALLGQLRAAQAKYKDKKPNTAEEKEEWRKAMRARQKLSKHNLKLVVAFAKRFHSGVGTLEFADLISCGNAGLIEAIDNRIDLSKGRLSTGAYHWIRQAMTEAIYWHSRTIRVPEHVWRTRSKINRAKAALIEEDETHPSPAKICERAGIAAEKYRKAEEAFCPIVTDSSLSGFSEIDASSEDLEEEAHSAEAAIAKKYLLSALDTAICKLEAKDPTTGYIVRHLFGINVEPMSAKAIADELNLSVRKVARRKRTGLETLKSEISPELLDGL